MSFTSRLYANEPIIDDSSLLPPEGSRGLELPPPAQRQVERSSYAGFAKAFDTPTMSRDEIRERIKEREQKGKILSELLQEKRVPTSDQNGTNFCWCYGVVSALNASRCWRNLPYVEYSRESVAAPIKGYSNRGGWGDQALKYMVEVGIMPQDLWPRYHLRSSQYNTFANLAIAAQHKVKEFWILRDRDFLQMMTALVLDHPVAVGYNWWSHEVCAVDPVIIGSNDLGVRIWNSWGSSYGSGGYAILTESRATADDAVIPVVQNIAA